MWKLGASISYGASLPDLYRRAATYVDKILRGAKPADLPVEQPIAFELNIKTAKELGLAISPTLLGSRRRGDRMRMPLAAAHESGIGTFETCRPALSMSSSVKNSQVIDLESGNGL